jgi:hypothetical protein
MKETRPVYLGLIALLTMQVLQFFVGSSLKTPERLAAIETVLLHISNQLDKSASKSDLFVLSARLEGEVALQKLQNQTINLNINKNTLSIEENRNRIENLKEKN